MYSAPSDDVTTAAEVLARAKQVALWRALTNKRKPAKAPSIKSIVIDREAIMFAALANPVRIRRAPKIIRAFHVQGIAQMPERVSIKSILAVVADHFALSIKDLMNDDRRQTVCRPRQIAMYLGRTMTAMSYPEIGRRIGGRDHTTIINGFRRVEHLIQTDDAMKDLLAHLELRIRAEMAQ